MSELIKDNAVSAETTKVRYSDEELEEFRTIINDMLDKARKEYNTLRRVIMHNGSNDIEDTTPSFKTVEDDGAYQLSKEEASQLAQRQYKFIQNSRPHLCASRTRLMEYAVRQESLFRRRGCVWCLMPRLL